MNYLVSMYGRDTDTGTSGSDDSFRLLMTALPTPADKHTEESRWYNRNEIHPIQIHQDSSRLLTIYLSTTTVDRERSVMC
jgi:hypothetical protein